MKRVAVCMRGAVGTPTHQYSTPNQLYHEKKYVQYVATRNAIQKHIQDTNPDYQFDFFLHCWNIDLQDNLESLYHPKKSSFEDNRLYHDEIIKKINHLDEFAGPSQCLSIKKSIQLKEEYEKEYNVHYDIVIVYRYDVLLWKDIDLSTYNVTQFIYVNKDLMKPRKGDLHFIMNSPHATIFSQLYDWLSRENRHCHGCIITYLRQKQIEYKEDSICLHFDTNILRKIHKSFMKKIQSVYGFTKDDIHHAQTHVMFSYMIRTVFVIVVALSSIVLVLYPSVYTFIYMVLLSIASIGFYYLLLCYMDICTSLEVMCIVLVASILFYMNRLRNATII
jgi:hypothetical protein